MRTTFKCIYLAASLSISYFSYSNEAPSKESSDSLVYVELDYLLWFANQDGLYYPTVATGSTPLLDSNWSSGARVAIGVQPSLWDTKLVYSYYSTRSNGQANANIETILSSCPSTSGIFEVNSRWKLNFNRLDWELGRKILFGHDFILRPHFGLEGLDIHQKFNLNTHAIFIDLDEGVPATDVIDSKNKNSFLSIGTRAGFNALFLLDKGFEFYGDFSGSLLWGKFKTTQEYPLSQNGSIFNCDLGIGFNWRHYFQSPKLQLLLTLGWEQHYYTDIVRFQNSYPQQSLMTFSNGNLALSGFTFGILLGY